MNASSASLPVLVAGGGIGGVAAALALVRRGFKVKVLEQAPQLGEIGAGIQFGPNAFAALDALGVGERARARAVYTDEMVMHDALDETLVGRIPTGEAFRQRFGNPYAVIHRADVHLSLLEGAQETDRVQVLTSTTVQRVEQDDHGVTVHDAKGNTHRGLALIGADGVKSAVRRQYVNDEARVSGHVVYRAVVDKKDFPADLQWNAASIWVGPNCHLVHYPLRGGEQYNVVVTFHSRDQEEWSVREGSREEVQSYFEGICPRARQLIDLPKDWKRWATADREPIGQWAYGRAALLGDAAHPTLQYLAQGACMALEDAVTLGEALRTHDNDFVEAFAHYQRSRVARTARVVLSRARWAASFHAKGVERLVRNDLWQAARPNVLRRNGVLTAGPPRPALLPDLSPNHHDHRLGRLEDLPADYRGEPGAAVPGAPVAQPALAAAAGQPRTSHEGHALVVRGAAPAAAARRRADADREGRAPRAGARQPGPRPGEHAGQRRDLPGHAAAAARRMGAGPSAHAERGAHDRPKARALLDVERREGRCQRGYLVRTPPACGSSMATTAARRWSGSMCWTCRWSLHRALSRRRRASRQAARGDGLCARRPGADTVFERAAAYPMLRYPGPTRAPRSNRSPPRSRKLRRFRSPK
jgi:salicylate hydroxylase